MSDADRPVVAALELTTEELLATPAGSLDTDRLGFTGHRGDASRHLDRAALEAALAVLPAAPRDRGTLDLMVARGAGGERHLPETASLTVLGGMPGDRWASDECYGPDYQLATARTDFARTVANGQPLELHGDNLFVSLDLSDANLPPGSLLQIGEPVLRVTPVPHNGCKKWVQRFGLPAMQLNMALARQGEHLRGIYLEVVEPGKARLGDAVVVVERARSSAPGGR
jgi:hypothetical protein